VSQFNLAKVFATVSAAVPERECIVIGDRRLTYAQVQARANRLANALVARGLGTHTERDQLAGHESGQDHLALYLYNGNEYLEGMLGGYGARVAPFNVNYRYVADELRYLLSDANAAGIVYSAAFAPTLAEIRDELPNLRLLVQVADDSGNALLDGAVDYEELLEGSSPEPPAVEPSPDDLYILYTGGTTGMPKGVLWRQDDIYVGAMGGRPMGSTEEFPSYEAIAQAAEASGGSVKMMPLPPFMHGAAQWGAFTAFTNGGTLVLQTNVKRLDPVDVWQVVAREKPITIMVVGDALARPVIEELESGDHDASSLIAVVNGGAPLNPALKERFLAALPGALVLDAVGSSETGAQMSHASAAGAKPTTGTFTPGPDTVVVSEELDRVLEAGHEGIGWLAQRGRVPLGYLGDADKTARTFPVIDGTRYAVPGDRARLLADGQLELLGRDSVTINSGGEKIFAEEVEKALAQHPAVYDVVVVGRPSERWGQEVVALVQVHPDATVTDEELLAEGAKTLARYKLPKAIVYLPELVRSPAGKADYRWARAQAITQ
jgi:fatty-acyl-CoA synthase